MIILWVVFAATVGKVLGHAVVQKPTPRKTGAAHREVCGAAVSKRLESDKAGPLENSIPYFDTDYNCDIFLCRGYQFGDSGSNVLALSTGDVVDFEIDLIAGHKPGYANVSIVSPETNTAIGQPLKLWSDWLNWNVDPSLQDYLEFNLTIPEGLESQCDVGGKCVLQWFWYAISNKQTYISCVDFYIE